MAIVDTLEAVRKLREAGMNETQAEAVVEVIGSASTNLMTKDDAAVLKAEIRADVFRVVYRVKADVYRAYSGHWNCRHRRNLHSHRHGPPGCYSSPRPTIQSS